MNLQDFVQESLVQIARATIEANKIFAKEGLKAQANPVVEGSSDTRKNHHPIEFDVALTAEVASEVSGNGGLKVWSMMNLGGETKSESSLATVSRVKFMLPLALPQNL